MKVFQNVTLAAVVLALSTAATAQILIGPKFVSACSAEDTSS